MAKAKMSNGGEINILSSRFQHVYVRQHGKIREITDLKNGTAGSIAPNAAKYTYAAGFHGDMHMMESADNSYKTTLNLITGSDDAKFFNALYELQLNSGPDDDTTFDVIYEDTSNHVKVTLEGSNIDTRPTIPIQNTDSTTAVSIHSGNMVDESELPDGDSLFN
ncbi:hypothetical protein [Fructilactobacillus florum]|uniref:Uncharacterized protein n=1 Tax=Fructilactobacillus florum DSM 22689 = JCM 16035 TaxID=1423745 RepID=A0A0R2CJ01_9LACO|nr:hypothetical protein [Fructilactobacillus florum]KRM91598.1 hypothetical protein FC87_GL000730 [Fructilactobacillus florum DSM 22689 = JCM 16035]